MELNLLRKDTLVAEVVSQARQGRSVGECQGTHTALFRKVNGEMAGNALAPAVADEDELVVAIMGLVSEIAYSRKAPLDPDFMACPIGHRCVANDVSERVKIGKDCLLHWRTLHFSSAVRLLITADFSMVLRWPTISTLSAPTTLPMNPTRSIAPPAAISGEVTARKASPAPTVSTTLRATAGIV